MYQYKLIIIMYNITSMYKIALTCKFKLSFYKYDKEEARARLALLPMVKEMKQC
jgi:hypothetical protein